MYRDSFEKLKAQHPTKRFIITQVSSYSEEKFSLLLDNISSNHTTKQMRDLAEEISVELQIPIEIREEDLNSGYLVIMAVD